MSRKNHYRDESQTRERLALLGLAADRSEPAGPCPDDDRFARLFEAEPGSAEHREFVEHLSRCQSCFQKWLILSEELSPTAVKRPVIGGWLGRRGLLGAIGSACALAMGVVLYLAIDYRPLPDDADLWLTDSKSNGSSISKPARSPLSETGLQPREKSPAHPAPAPAVSDAASAAQNSRQELDRTALEEQVDKPIEPPARSFGQMTKPEMVRTPSMQADTADHADMLAGEPMSRETKALAVSKELRQQQREGPIIAGSTPVLDDLRVYVDLLVDLCDEQKEGPVSAGLYRQALEKGRGLLAADLSGEIQKREFIEQTMQLLEKEIPVNDKDWGRLCERARGPLHGPDEGHPPKKQ